MTGLNLGKGENQLKCFLKDAIKESDKLYEENKQLKKENEELKQVLGSILLEVKREISYYKYAEVTVAINHNTYDLINHVLEKYNALK